MQIKFIVLTILIILFSCDKQQDAVGNHNELIVITSYEDKEFVKLHLYDIIYKYINTPVEEKIYNVKFIKPEKFSHYKFHKNLIIASLKHPIDDTIDLLYNRFSESYKESNIFTLKNLYANGQIIILLGAHDSIQFEENIITNKEWIENEITENVNFNIYSSYKNREVNPKIEKIINDNFAIDLFIDEDYKIINSTKDFLWIGRGFPYRWFMLYKDTITTKDDYWNMYSTLLYNNTDGINISKYYKNKYIDDSYVLLTGLYEHEISDTGGPFFVYIFENNTNNEVILVSGFVNNPGKDKYPLLNEMKVLVKNMKRK